MLHMENIKQKRAVRVFILLISIFLLANIVRMLAIKNTAISSNVNSIIPYHVMLRETLHHKDGKSTRGIDATYAVRSDEAVVNMAEDLNTKMPVTWRKVFFPSGLTIVINDVYEMKSSTLNEATRTFSGKRDPKSNCMLSDIPVAKGQKLNGKEEIIGNEKINGYHTVMIKNQNITCWYALDLGCAMLKSLADFGDRGISEENAIMISQGEPAENLFKVSARYAEVAPSVFYGIAKDSQDAVRRDIYYWSHRPN